MRPKTLYRGQTSRMPRLSAGLLGPREAVDKLYLSLAYDVCLLSRLLALSLAHHRLNHSLEGAL